MSFSFLCQSRDRLPMLPGVTLRHVLDALRPFMSERGVAIDDDSDDSVIEFADPDNALQIDRGGVAFRFVFSARFSAEAYVDNLARALEPMMAQGAVVELYNQSLSPASEESSTWHYFGPSEGARRCARLKHGLELAQEVLEPVLGREGFGAIKASAMSMAGQDHPVERATWYIEGSPVANVVCSKLIGTDFTCRPVAVLEGDSPGEERWFEFSLPAAVSEKLRPPVAHSIPSYKIQGALRHLDAVDDDSPSDSSQHRGDGQRPAGG